MKNNSFQKKGKFDLVGDRSLGRLLTRARESESPAFTIAASSPLIPRNAREIYQPQPAGQINNASKLSKLGMYSHCREDRLCSDPSSPILNLPRGEAGVYAYATRWVKFSKPRLRE